MTPAPRSVEEDPTLASVRQRVAGYARRRLSAEDAEDLVQEAFVLLVTKYADVSDSNERVKVAIQIVANLAASHWRRSQRRGEKTAVDAANVPLEDGRPDPEALAAKQQLSDRLRKAVECMRGRCREVVRLRLEDRTSQEIAEILGGQPQHGLLLGTPLPEEAARAHGGGGGAAMTGSARDLLGGYVFGTLTREEEEELLQASLLDQELFDALVEQEPLRELLADRAVRREALAVLERPSRWERVRAFFRRPPTWVDLAAAASVVLAAVVLVRSSWTPAPRSAASPAAVYEQLFALSPRVATPARLDVVEPPRGDLPGILAVSVDAESAVLVLERQADGVVVPLFPATARERLVRPGGRLTIPTSATSLPTRVRLVVFPSDVDPLSLEPGALRALEGRLTIVEREIAPGGSLR